VDEVRLIEVEAEAPSEQVSNLASGKGLRHQQTQKDRRKAKAVSKRRNQSSVGKTQNTPQRRQKRRSRH